MRHVSKWLMVFSAGVLALAAGGLRAGPEEAPPADQASPALDAKALAELGLEHSRSRDELLAIEARLALLAEKLYGSRLVVHYRGELDTPFSLSAVELYLDSALAYRQEFERSPTSQALKLFDAYLPPGRHAVEVRIWAKGPDETGGEALPAYTAGAGLAVHLREKGATKVLFEAEQDGDPPDAEALREDELEGSWDVDIRASFETEK